MIQSGIMVRLRADPHSSKAKALTPGAVEESTTQNTDKEVRKKRNLYGEVRDDDFYRC